MFELDSWLFFGVVIPHGGDRRQNEMIQRVSVFLYFMFVKFLFKSSHIRFRTNLYKSLTIGYVPFLRLSGRLQYSEREIRVLVLTFDYGTYFHIVRPNFQFFT